MLRSLSASFFLLSLLTSACTANKGGDHSKNALSPQEESETANFFYAQAVLCSRRIVEEVGCKEGTLSIERMDMPLFPASPDHKLAYQAVMVTPKASGIPEGEYILYCPSTGCPVKPEFGNKVIVDDKGALLGETKLAPDLPPIHGELSISIYAIPGFSSDWYLISTKDFSIHHAAFDFQPIIATGSAGQTLQLMKKECGGNVIDVVMKGFQPNEVLTFSSNSAGEVCTRSYPMDENGCRRGTFLPTVIGVPKGTVTVTVATTKEQITASTDWNNDTLNIRREQRPTPFIKVLEKKTLEALTQVQRMGERIVDVNR